jgi:hypothetical protein
VVSRSAPLSVGRIARSSRVVHLLIGAPGDVRRCRGGFVSVGIARI